MGDKIETVNVLYAREQVYLDFIFGLKCRDVSPERIANMSRIFKVDCGLEDAANSINLKTSVRKMED